MKKVLALLFLFSATLLIAQQESQYTTIVDQLEKSSTGGKVRIYQNDSLAVRMGAHAKGNHVQKIDDQSIITLQGYRIQIFSGNNQRASKAEAFRKEVEIKEIAPELETYVTYNSPFWQLRAGNFRTFEEADRIMRQLKVLLPKYGKEMYVVRSEVKFSINENDIK